MFFNSIHSRMGMNIDYNNYSKATYTENSFSFYNTYGDADRRVSYQCQIAGITYNYIVFGGKTS